jgi:hypothetical protein
MDTKLDDNVTLLALTLAMQMIGNGASISNKDLVRFQVCLARGLGIQIVDFNINTMDSAVCNFDPRMRKHYAYMIMLIRSLSRLFDKYHLNLDQEARITRSSRNSKEIQSEDQSPMKSFYSELSQRAQHHLPWSKRERNTQAKNDEGTDSTRNISEHFCRNFFQILITCVSTLDVFLTLDICLMKDWLETILIYLYKVNLMFSHKNESS